MNQLDIYNHEKDIFPAAEKKILKLFNEILRTREIRRNDSFFESGGNSLLAISLINKLENELGISISYRDLIMHSTIADLGKYIEENSSVTTSSAGIVHLRDLNNLPLTQSQARIWLITRMNPSIPNYILPFAYRLNGPLKIDIFRRSIDALFSRHQVLFSRIIEREGIPCCIIEKTKVHIEFIDYSDIDSKDGESRIFELINKDSRRVFDLTTGPLYRLYLFKLSNNEFYFYYAIHHIVFDGWSWKVFIDDLNQIYNDLEADREILLKELPYQQYDYAHWEKQTGLLKDETKLIKYWKSQLEGCSSQLNFPYDFQRLNNTTGFGEKERIEFPPDISSALRQISKNEGVSLFATMMSAFGILMHKYSGDIDLNIGTPVANRPHSSFEKVVGMFVNTLVIRFQLDQEISFNSLLKRTNEVILDAITYQDLQFEKIVEIVNPPRVSNANPVFQVAFAWEDNLSVPLNLGKIKADQIFIHGVTTPFDITCSMYINGESIEGSLSYNTDLISKDTAARLCDNFVTLVSNLVNNREVPISSVPMITDDENQKILSFTETTTQYPNDKTIVQLFEERVTLNSKSIAIISDKSKITYSELNEKATLLAGVLQEYGIGPGDFIGLLLKRSPELIICLLAIFKTGAAYVPLNLADPENRVKSNIISSKIKYLILNTGPKLNLEGICSVLTIENLISQNCDFRDSFKPIEIPSTDPAYIIFTSGTTGTPKGVLVNHKSVINLIEWVNNTFNITLNDKLLWVTNLNFDLSVYDIFGILAAGGSIRIVNDEDRQDPKKLYHLLINEGITFWDSAPQNLQQLTPFFNNGQDPGLFNSLRLVFLSGDWIPLSLPPLISSNFPSAIVAGLGGATEATIWSNYFIINKINPDWKSIPYGKPIQNSRYYILDDKMNHCRIQQPGNLYIGGDCLAMGYYNDPALTDSKFIPDPFNSGSKLYLTGDKAQWMTDGNIEFLGREDEQLKIRGYRVEIGEIQSVALKNKAIKEAIVIPDKSDRHNIKALLFITAFDDKKLEVKDLKREFRENLPEYMIPTDIIQYREFPLTLNGKIDTKGMLSNYAESIINNEDSLKIEKTGKDKEILTPTEKIIYKIWCETLKTEGISPTDNFFDSGGNSLLAISLINKLENELGVSISYRDLIMHSSIADLGKYLEDNSSIIGSSAGLIHLTDLDNLPLTQSQTRIWLITRMNPSIPNYIIPFAYHLIGPLKIDIFRKSIDVLFSRHHVLFSRIIEKEGVPCCVIEKTEVQIEFIDYSYIESKDGESRIFKLINEDSRRVFDLANGPLYRLYIFKLSDEEYYFYCAIHHIVFDGWSWKIFIDDLNQIYNALDAGREISLKELAYQQYDFAHWEKQTSILNDETKLIKYWKSQLEGCSTQLDFPYDFPRLNNSTGLGEKVKIQLSPDISSALRQISKNEGVSLFATMMSAFGILMHKYSGDNDLNIGTPVANRSHSSFENVVGMFVNTLVIRLQLDQEISFNSLLRKTNEVILDAIAYQDLQFEKIVEIVNPERLSNANPIFQVAFAWEDNLSTPLDLGVVRSEPSNIDGGTSLFDITCSLYNNGNRIEGSLIYNTDLIRKDTATRLCANFVNLVSNLVNNNDAPIFSVPIITDIEKQKVLSFTETSTDYPKESTIVQLFEEKVRENHHKHAIVFHNDTLTYDQLNRKSNQLARTLREKAEITRDTPIGILADKSTDLIVGILSILKSGGAYVPIDPEYPQQRIDFIIRDSGCRIILTQDKYMNLTIENVLKISINSSGSYNPDESNVENINNPTDLAYIMYTSGTTGVPKGSMIEQQSVVRLVRNTNYIDLQENTRILLTGAIVFDASTFEIWGTLLNGGSLYIVEKETILDARTLGQELLRNDINTLWLTSALFTNLAESRTNIFGKLKYLLVGGDVLSVPHINKVRKNNPMLKVINGYGPTENTTFSTCFEINREYDRNIPIGKPISNSTAYIFDKSLNYQPIGVKGELYVGGDGVSRGYLNRDDLNKLSFIDHPCIPGERLYKTGDYARWLPDGNIEFLGRIDNQVKMRGFRIELEEIETVLAEIEGIKEAVVNPIRIDENDVRLVAFLNVREDFSIDLPEVSKRITGKLPPYMIPYFYKTMHGFPITVNGKIDRKSLTIDLSEIKEDKIIEIRELTSTQKRVLKIWQDIIKVRSIGLNENFFDAGGTSLLAVRVVDRIEKEFNIIFELHDFFNNPIIQKIAEYIDIRTYPLMTPGKTDSIQKTGGDNKIITGEL